jgi:hypothetical protein
MPDGSGSINVQRLIAEVAARHKFLLNPDDPALALVTMNQLILDASLEVVHEQIRVTITEFHASIQKAEKRAGTMLAQTVKESAVQMQAGLQSDIQVAGLKAREIVHLVNEAHRRPALIRWSTTGLLAGALLFGGGVWLGTLLR